ncbi:hypothetical protein GOODEAATRI_030520, partial [Goodea atripinnis]
VPQLVCGSAEPEPHLAIVESPPPTGADVNAAVNSLLAPGSATNTLTPTVITSHALVNRRHISLLEGAGSCQDGLKKVLMLLAPRAEAGLVRSMNKSLFKGHFIFCAQKRVTVKQKWNRTITLVRVRTKSSWCRCSDFLKSCWSPG